MAYLKQRVNGETVNVYELGDSVTIGRHLECQIVVDDPTISARHAQLNKLQFGYLLKDLGSTNGILIGKEKTLEHNLAAGDVFVLGTHEFEYLEALPVDLEQTLKIKKSWIPGIYYAGKS